MVFCRTPMALLIWSLMMITFTVMLGFTNAAKENIQDWVEAHNSVRRPLGLRPLVWNPEIARYAKWYANQRRADCALEHSSTPMGENLAWADFNITGVEAVKMWTDEVKDYDYDSNTCRVPNMCGHYTQAVWRHTYFLGCAKIKCHTGATFFICNYFPPGNFAGEKPF